MKGPVLESQASPLEKPASPGPAPVPFQLSRYELVRLLGQGGMGEVYLAQHRNLKKLVAVKVLKHRRFNDSQLARFRHEMEAIGRLNHAHVVQATDADEENGVLFLVMEYVPGLSVHEALQRRGRLQPADACAIVRQAALGLACIHEHRLVHRDIKPSNLILTREGTVKILDLGLALVRDLETGTEITTEGCPLGTAEYMAPEQAYTPHEVDGKADIYSLGCMFYKLLTGTVPFGGYSSFPQKVDAHCHEPFPLLPASIRSAAELNPILQRMTAKKPGERYASARDVANVLEVHAQSSRLADLVEGEGPADLQSSQAHVATPNSLYPSTIDSPLGRRLAEPKKKRVVIGLVLGALLVCGLGLAAWQPWRGDHPDPQGKRPNPNPAAPDQPVRLAVGQPPDLDHLKLQKPLNLLERQPVLALEEGISEVFYFPKSEELRIDARSTALALLGSTHAESFSVRMELFQPLWPGRIGLVLGYQETDPSVLKTRRPGKVGHYQVVMVRKGVHQDGVTPIYTARRQKMTVEMNKEGRLMHQPMDPWSEVIDMPQGSKTLEVVIRNRAMVKASFGGVELTELTQPKTNALFAPGDYRGGIGAIVAGGADELTPGFFSKTTFNHLPAP